MTKFEDFKLMHVGMALCLNGQIKIKKLINIKHFYILIYRNIAIAKWG